jgi:hypothetical protein
MFNVSEQLSEQHLALKIVEDCQVCSNKYNINSGSNRVNAQ